MTEQTRFNVYHDETKRTASPQVKGHVLLFVPHRAAYTEPESLFGSETRTVVPRQFLIEGIAEIRRECSLETKKLHFNEHSGRRWTRPDSGHRAVADFAVEALSRIPTRRVAVPLGLKVAVLFYEPKADLGLYGGGLGERVLRHDETVLRMLLKGAMHFLFDETEAGVVEELVCDGQPAHRPLDASRILQRLVVEEGGSRTAVRGRVTVSPAAKIRVISSAHTDHPVGSVDWMDAQLLQLSDLFLGAISRSCFQTVVPWRQPPAIGAIGAAKKDVIAYPVFDLLRKTTRGRGFKASRHFRTFSVARVFFERDSVSFSRLSPEVQKPGLPKLQLQFNWSD